MTRQQAERWRDFLFRQVRQLEDSGTKTAGILDPFLTMPFSALAAAITAPGGSRGRAGAIGALLGAGMASLAQKEYAERLARGEKVSPVDFNPLFQSVLAGLATGGGARVVQDLHGGEGVRPLSAVLAGAPAGAMLLSSNPVAGAGLGTMGGFVASVMTRRERPARQPYRMTPADFDRIRMQLALRRAHARIQALQAWLATTRPGSASVR